MFVELMDGWLSKNRVHFRPQFDRITYLIGNEMDAYEYKNKLFKGYQPYRRYGCLDQVHVLENLTLEMVGSRSPVSYSAYSVNTARCIIRHSALRMQAWQRFMGSSLLQNIW